MKQLFILLTVLLAFGLVGCNEPPPGEENNSTPDDDGKMASNMKMAEKAPEGTRGKSRKFEFTYVAKIEKPAEGTKVQKIWIPVPQTNAYQDIKLKNVSAPDSVGEVKYHMDKEYGNKAAYYEVKDPKEELEITFTYECTRYEHTRNKAPKNPEAKPNNKRFLEPTRLLLVNEHTKKEAQDLTKGKEKGVEKFRAFYNKVIKLMKYGKPADRKGHGMGDGWGDGSTKWAQEQCIGNCTDFHAYYLSLCRSLEIPCRFEIGAWLHSDKNEGKVGYHCWALSWDKEYGWFPVDISEGWKGPNAKNKPELEDYYFGNHCVNRIQFSTGRDVQLEPKQAGPRLNYFIYPYSEADGKPVKTNADFSYKDM